MKDKLARTPQLEDIIRKAANRLGENHGLTRDNHGATIDNQGNSSRYVGSGGRHPYRYNQPKTTTTDAAQGWYKSLNEGCGDEDELEEEKIMGRIKKILKSINPFNETEQEVTEIENQVMKKLRKLKNKIFGEEGEMEEEELEMGEATGASSAGGYVGPLFAGTMDESERILKSVIREEISKKVPEVATKEALKNRLVEKAFYNTGEFKYEKPTKSPGEIKNTPGVRQTDSTLKKSKSENNSYLKQFDKKLKDYLDFEGNSHPEFPHQNNSKTDYKSPMYRNTGKDEEFIDDFRGMGLEDANGVDMLDRIEDYLSGSQETGNAQTGKDGKALGNVVPNKGVGEKLLKKVKRKKEKIAQQKSKMTNLRGMTPDVQTVTNLKESVVNKDVEKIKHLFNYKGKTQ